MTYNVFGGTLDLAQFYNSASHAPVECKKTHDELKLLMRLRDMRRLITSTYLLLN